MFGLILAIACMVIWGLTDIFDKKGSPREDPLACYKFMVWQGIISSILVIALAPMSETGILLPAQLRKNAVYILISMAYPISIMFGLNGMRYLDASIASPLENIDGMIAPIFMLIYFLATGTIESIGSVLSVWNFIGVALVITGVILIGKVEQELADQDTTVLADGKKKRIGAKALIFPLAYSIFDAAFTVSGGVILYSEGSVAMGEMDYTILYNLAFAVSGLFSYLYIWVKTKHPYHPFRKTETPKLFSGIMDPLGGVCYTYALAANPVLFAPITSSYCVVTIFASHILLKEKLQKKQYTCLGILVAGIVILAVSSGEN